ncbi:MAG TPA: D-ribose ABC transporter substrate-binding protein [Pseudogracilibacillus sp.]|nr:D-ribose ABC transporter substrate-binding protein [Pseudogracilibacillus sp.]
MKKGLLSFLALVLIVVLAACSTEKPGSDSADEGTDDATSEETGDMKVGFSISTLNNPFFVDLRDGAEASADTEGIEIVVADAQDDSSKQISDIEDLLQQGIDLLLVNPTDDEAVVAGIEAANAADIPVITVDRSSEGGEVITHIASDNVAGGEMAGEHIVELLGDDGGEMIELEGIPGVAATTERGEGFHNVIDELDEIDVVASQTANFDRTEGLSVMENLLQGNKDISAVFAHNDEMALGAVEALESQGMLDDVIVVGFDATDDARTAVEDGRMEGTIAQQPELISEAAIKAAIDVLNGEELDDFIPVELELIK